MTCPLSQLSHYIIFSRFLVVLLFNNERLFVNNPPLQNNTRPLFEKDDNCFCRSK